jgi:hypothetical protein
LQFEASPADTSQDPLSKNPSQKGLVEWFKMQALSSSSSTRIIKKKEV